MLLKSICFLMTEKSHQNAQSFSSKYLPQLESIHVEDTQTGTSARIIQNMDIGMHHAKNRGNKEIPLAILSTILAQSCITLCLNHVGRVTHDCVMIFALVPHIFHGLLINAATRTRTDLPVYFSLLNNGQTGSHTLLQ